MLASKQRLSVGFLLVTAACTLYVLSRHTFSADISAIGRHSPTIRHNKVSWPCQKQAQCSWVDTKRNHSRFLIIGPVHDLPSGIGAFVGHLAVFFEMAVKYDLHLAFRGNFTVTRGYDRSKWFDVQDVLGFTASNVAISADDPILKRLPVRNLPINLNISNSLLEEEFSIDKVVYDVGRDGTVPYNTTLVDNIARPLVGRLGHQDVPCESSAQVLQRLYQNARSPHHCPVFPTILRQSNRFNVAVHIRRGDLFILDSEKMRHLEHGYYIATVALAIRALVNVMAVETDVISIAVFSESGTGVIVDEKGVNVDMKSQVSQMCSEVGVNCEISLQLTGDPLEIFHCFTVAHLLIASYSRYSYVGGMVNINVKVFPREWGYNDTVDTVTVDQYFFKDTEAKINAQQRLDKVVVEWNQRRQCQLNNAN